MKTHRFKKIYVEITSICNLDCDFCPKNARLKKFMSAGEFDSITSKLTGYGKFLYFHVMGEPLLHPGLGEFLQIADSKGFRVNITTNGTLLKEASEVLLGSKALRQVNISLHSFEANRQDITMKKYLGDIVSFTRAALQETELIISLRLWNMEENLQDTRNNDVFELLEDGFGLGCKLGDELKNKKSVKIADRLYLNMAERFEWPDMRGAVGKGRAFCYGLRDQIGVLSDGTVIPCCLDSEGAVNLGNLLEQSLEEILQSKRAVEIYNGFTEGRASEELCKRCGYRERFQG